MTCWICPLIPDSKEKCWIDLKILCLERKETLNMGRWQTGYMTALITTHNFACGPVHVGVMPRQGQPGRRRRSDGALAAQGGWAGPLGGLSTHEERRPTGLKHSSRYWFLVCKTHWRLMTQCENSLELELMLPHNQGWCDQKSCLAFQKVKWTTMCWNWLLMWQTWLPIVDCGEFPNSLTNLWQLLIVVLDSFLLSTKDGMHRSKTPVPSVSKS